mmetsp:Transcript_28051/g.24770  ORF Transcript_28051/g.24770 Transcript_28051/m.24770 type:complete len:234 (+) Transcript_28051:776-1477(+)
MGFGTNNSRAWKQSGSLDSGNINLDEDFSDSAYKSKKNKPTIPRRRLETEEIKISDDSRNAEEYPTKLKLERKDSFESLGFGGSIKELEKNSGSSKRKTRASNSLKRKYYNDDDWEDNDFSKEFFGESDEVKKNDDFEIDDEESFSGSGKRGGGKSKGKKDGIRKSKTIKGYKMKRSDSFENLGFGNELSNQAGTLVVVPLTVINQWESEIMAHSEEGTMTVFQYHGTNRKNV